jgi:hypothetical protein
MKLNKPTGPYAKACHHTHNDDCEHTPKRPRVVLVVFFVAAASVANKHIPPLSASTSQTYSSVSIWISRLNNPGTEIIDSKYAVYE